MGCEDENDKEARGRGGGRGKDEEGREGGRTPFL